jgi:hypothetical protein
MSWQPFENGATLGQRGAEGGKIVQDAEYTNGARITLEVQCKRAPVAITAGVYGWLVHTCFYSDQMTAEAELDFMKTDLATIADLRADAGIYSHVDDLYQAIEAFQEKY